jgi:hypothetical protein
VDSDDDDVLGAGSRSRTLIVDDPTQAGRRTRRSLKDEFAAVADCQKENATKQKKN